MKVKMEYIARCAVNNILRNKFFTVLNIIALMISFFFPVIILAVCGSSFLSSYYSIPKDMDRVGGIVVISDRQINLNPYEIRNEFPEIEYIASSAGKKSILYSNGRTSLGYVKSVGIENEKIIYPYIVRGRGFNQNDYNEKNNNCLITGSLDSNLGGNIKTVRIGDIEFNVIGIINNTIDGNSVILPPISYAEIDNPYASYSIKLNKGYSYKIDGGEIARRLAAKYDFDYYSGDVLDYYAEHKYIDGQTIAVFIVFAVVILLYSMMNVSTVLLAKYENESKSFRIKLLLGATRAIISLQIFITILIYVLTAVLLDIILINLALPFLNNIPGLYLDINFAVILTAFFTAIFTTFIISLRIVSKLFKKQFNN